MKTHYFNQDKADKDDIFLNMAKTRGYVPITCLLGGGTVIGLMNERKDPCKECECNRLKCKGRPKI